LLSSYFVGASDLRAEFRILYYAYPDVLVPEVYDRDGRKLGLTRYPQYDPNGNVDADPFDRSWPKVVRDHWQILPIPKRRWTTLQLRSTRSFGAGSQNGG
jgi:hypothetical protein